MKRRIVLLGLLSSLFLAGYPCVSRAAEAEKGNAEKAPVLLSEEPRSGSGQYNGGFGTMSWRTDGDTMVISGNLFNCDGVLPGLEGLWKDMWEVSYIRFENCKIRGNINKWFKCITPLKGIDMSGLDTSEITGMKELFYGCVNLEEINLRGMDTSRVTDMQYMFKDCHNLTNLDVSCLNTSNVKNMNHMFSGCTSLTSLDLSTFDTSNVTDMSHMFDTVRDYTSVKNEYDRMGSLTSLNLSGWDTSKVTNMSCMFYECVDLVNLNLSGWSTSSVTDMSSMFLGCSSLVSLDLSGFHTSRVTNMNAMFWECKSLTGLDLSSFDVSKDARARQMFVGCKELLTIQSFGRISNGSSIALPDYYVDQNGTMTDQITPQYAGKTLTRRDAVPPTGKSFAVYDGYTFYKDGSGNVTCYNGNGRRLINDFKCDGVYTYYFQADGTAMKDRLSYHPDGKHVIYFDQDGHEVFSSFANVKRTISGEAVDDFCFFDVYGYLYVDVVTYDKTGTVLYYANPYGVMERGKWFQFSSNVKWADGKRFDGAGGYGYANEDGTLLTNEETFDWEGRPCYLQGNGVALYR